MLVTLPVGEVAVQLGYGDAATFSRQFRQATGVSPKTLRQRVARG
jgi:AraC-like DNA-binding protein